MIRSSWYAALVLACPVVVLGWTEPAMGAGPVWRSDYRAAVLEAQQAHKMLLIYFSPLQRDAATDHFEQVTLRGPQLEAGWQRHVALQLKADAPAQPGGGPLLQHPAFGFMRGQAGLAVLDFLDPQSPHWHRVVTQIPFTSVGRLNAHQMAIVMDLPPASLTQRTLIFAVRTHPEIPQSASGQFDPVLAQEAERHSLRQAAMRLQGHHEWGTRFQQISYQLPMGLAPQEVCAESWPHQDLVEAAVDCVHSWRQSPGHWSALRRRQPLFGFDMKRGSNGIWYATGLFGNRGN